MKKTKIAGLIGLLFTQSALADSTSILTSNVVVTASRTLQSTASVLGDITVIDRSEIERASTNSITDLLAAQPGVQVTTNGGAGKTSSVFLRGTNSDHVVVLIDGMRINSATLGTTSFESIPLSQIEKIEILRGPASSLYGADAIGGVIQIFTKKGGDNKPALNAAVGLGSYRTKTAEAGISGGVGDTRYGIQVSSFATAGFSARRILGNSTPIDKDNDGYRNLSVSAYLEHTFVPGHTLGAQFFQSTGHNDYDGGNNYSNYGNQTLQSYAITSNNQFTDFWLSTLKLGMGIDDSDDHFKPSFFSPTGQSNFRSEQKQYSWQNDLSLPLGTLTLAYDRLEQSVSGSTTYDQTHRNNNGYLASYLLDHGQHTLQLSLRDDDNSQFGSHSTGGIAYGYRFTPEWRASASYGTAFKAPTFNQLYYPSFGNPNLSPEESKNVEASIRYETPQLRAGFTVFDNKIDNLIAFTGPPTGFNPVNVAKAEIFGSTLDGTWRVTDSWTLKGNLTVQSPRDESTNNLLTRRSNRYGAVSLLHNWGDFQWSAEVAGASTRYNDAENTKKMDGYALLNLTANYRITPEWKLEARANNLLNKNYILAYSGNSASSDPYNTAGTNVFVGLRYQMKP